MSTTVTYKGSTLTTVSNGTRILTTQGKYLEDNITLVDVTSGGGSGDGYVWQDQDGYVHLSDEQGTQTIVEPLSVTQNGTYTASTGHAYSPVTVSVSGGSANYVTGTFTTSSTTGITQTVNIPYTGSGYPIALIIEPTGGFYGNSAFYDLIKQYVTVTYSFTKLDTNTAPTYTNAGTANQNATLAAYVYKSSSSSSTTTSRTSGTPSSFSGDTTAYANVSQVMFKDSKTMNIFVASSSYGFAPGIGYTYRIIYSS